MTEPFLIDHLRHFYFYFANRLCPVDDSHITIYLLGIYLFLISRFSAKLIIKSTNVRGKVQEPNNLKKNVTCFDWVFHFIYFLNRL